MAREITCYVFDAENTERVFEHIVTIATKAGYTKPTVRDMDNLETKLTATLHRTGAALRKATWTPYDLDVDLDDAPRSVPREQMDVSLQEQADQYDADLCRRRSILRRKRIAKMAEEN